MHTRPHARTRAYTTTQQRTHARTHARGVADQQGVCKLAQLRNIRLVGRLREQRLALNVLDPVNLVPWSCRRQQQQQQQYESEQKVLVVRGTRVGAVCTYSMWFAPLHLCFAHGMRRRRPRRRRRQRRRRRRRRRRRQRQRRQTTTTTKTTTRTTTRFTDNTPSSTATREGGEAKHAGRRARKMHAATTVESHTV
jgi:hypothetical protein